MRPPSPPLDPPDDPPLDPALLEPPPPPDELLELAASPPVQPRGEALPREPADERALPPLSPLADEESRRSTCV